MAKRSNTESKSEERREEVIIAESQMVDRNAGPAVTPGMPRSQPRGTSTKLPL